MTIYFQQVWEMGNFLGLEPADSKVTTTFEAWSKSMLEEPVVNFKNPVKTSREASLMYLLNQEIIA